jgi:hypothetical protein
MNPRKPTFLHGQHTAGAGASKLDVVSGHDERSALVGEASQYCRQVAAPRRIERSRGFVHQEERRSHCQRPRYGDALCFTPRQLTRICIGPVPDAEPLEELARATFRLRTGLTLYVHRRQPHVVQRREVLKEMMKLKHHPDLAMQLSPRIPSGHRAR